MEGGCWQAFFTAWLLDTVVVWLSYRIPATGGEVIMYLGKAENVPGRLAECEGITTDIAVLKQVSGHLLCHEAVPWSILTA